ncbi:MAG: hypothetical protein L0241_28030 [Planctomycetia bacterium]|nr:hypothetical protein [Planctomycetia bacterium]
MADEKELHELKERITRLKLRDQLHLFEMVLADYRRRWDEEVAAQMAANAALLADGKLQRALTAPFTFPPETKREAG